MERKHKVSDSVLIEFADQTVLNLGIDLAAFTAFDPDLNEAKVAELAAAIDASLDMGTDESVKAKMKQLTAEVNLALKACQESFSTIRYFARKAFKDQPAILRQFGFNEYRKVRQNQDKMVLFFNELTKTVAQYRDVLMAKGASQQLVDSISLQAKALAETNANQEAFISQQPVTTTARVKTFHALYDLLLEFSDAAEIVFAGQPEKRSLYSLPHNDSPSDEQV